MSGPGDELRSERFRRERQASWDELEQLLERVRRDGLDSLGPEALRRLPALHRAAAASLGVARTISLDRHFLRALESLVTRSALCVYGHHGGLAPALASALVAFPRAVRRHRRAVGLAAATLLAGLATGLVLTTLVPERFFSFVPEALAGGRDPDATTAFLRDGLYERTSLLQSLGHFASYLFSHNAGIGMLCFGLGFLAGVPVFVLLFHNGLILGAMSALYHQRGLGLDWWGWVLPHGVTELLALVLCGAAGLVIGRGLVFPGELGRLEALAAGGRRAALLIAGGVALLFVAALIEGFFRQLVTDVTLRYALVALTTLGWSLYLLRVGRGAAGDDEGAEVSR